MPPDLASAETINKEHGRIENPHIAGTRRRLVRGVESVETVYAITSLTADIADAATLLALSRSH